MLFKLLKYDFKSMLRTFVPLWSILLIASLVNYAMLDNEFFEGSSAIGYLIVVALLVAVCTITVILVIQRFYNGLLKDEGYLMFTLPVQTWQLVLSKYLTALSIFILSSAVAFTSFIFLTTYGFAYREVWKIIGNDYLLDAALLFLCNIMSTIALIYLAMAVGHLFYKHRVPISIAAYIAISIVISKLEDVLFVFRYDQAGVDSMIPAGAFFSYPCEWFILLMAAVYLALTILILNKRLNLE